jgi:very-short-patch-repair endonuclease
LSYEELATLYRTNAELTPTEEGEINEWLPDAADLSTSLLAPPAFAEAISASEYVEPAECARAWANAVEKTDVAALTDLRERVASMVTDIGTLAPWQRALVALGHASGNGEDHVSDAERGDWAALHQLIKDAVSAAADARAATRAHEIECGGLSITTQTVSVVRAIEAQVAAGKSIGVAARMFHREWSPVIELCRIDGASPSTAEHFAALAKVMQADLARRAVAGRWRRQAEQVGLPAFESLPEPREQTLLEYAKQFDDLLSWWPSRSTATVEAMYEAGFNWQTFQAEAIAHARPATPLDRNVAILADACEVVWAREHALARIAARGALGRLVEALRGYRGPVCAALRGAVQEKDLDAYARWYDELVALEKKRTLVRTRAALLERLSAAAPAWANAIRGRDDMHGAPTPPGRSSDGADTIPAAWRWRQMAQEVERRATLDERVVARTLRDRRTALRATTTRLIDRKAWLAQSRRTDLAARQALIGWADTQKKIGKGTGRLVPTLQARARELLAAARDAVPVWIMPMARVVESFDPRKGLYDVVIVDEASQSDVTGLLAFYAGAKVVVVGDHEQVSPSAIGQKLDDITSLIAQHLVGVPNAHLYDGKTSVYDLARQSFGGAIALREHFRCAPDIIEFSNQLSYLGQIRPLRNPAHALAPHVSELCVPASGQAVAGVTDDRLNGTGTETRALSRGRWRSRGSDADANINHHEARWAAAIIGAMVEHEAYRGRSIGAIGLVGDEQPALILKMAVEVVGPTELHQRRFIAGTPAQFQGDERDVVLLSMVDQPTGGTLRLREDTVFKQRYNVAASRARDQLWLMHSLAPERDLQPADLRRRLIEHVRDPQAVARSEVATAPRAESGFEHLMIAGLVAAGFRVMPQVEIGRYRIDLVVSDGRSQIALECDGDRFQPLEQIPYDLARQAVLERAGWTFVRVRGTRFFRDPEGTMASVIAEIEQHGVGRATTELDERAGRRRADGDGDALRDAIIRRASAIMSERGWVARTTATDTRI